LSIRCDTIIQLPSLCAGVVTLAHLAKRRRPVSRPRDAAPSVAPVNAYRPRRSAIANGSNRGFQPAERARSHAAMLPDNWRPFARAGAKSQPSHFGRTTPCFFLSFFLFPPRQPAGRPDREPTRCPSRAFPGGNRTEGRMWSTGASPHVMSELRASSDSIPVIGAQGTRGAACPERMNRCQDEPQTWALSRVVEARRVSTFTHFTRHPLWASRVCNLEWPPALK